MRKLTPFILIAALFLTLLSGCVQNSAQNGETASSETSSETLWVNVTLSGGSGKASVASPAELCRQADGSFLATICWSSSNYDYMVVDGETYQPVSTDGGSVFEIPVPSTSCTISVQADTVAMSKPYLIDYTLTFGGETAETSETETAAAALEPISSIQKTDSMELSYAKEFTVDYYEGNLTLVTIAGTDRFLLVPEGGTVPDDLPSDITILQQPLTNIYMVASAMMDMFAACDGMGSLGSCALEENNWYVDAAKDAMQAGTLTYAGKYSDPDYERLSASGCSLAVENTMVLHSPEVVEELENLGIPVLIEHSSYEATPQGRIEWVKLAGLLTDHEAAADAAFEKQMQAFDEVARGNSSGKTAAFFYVTTTGTVSVRNASDYIPKMIELAGGKYAFPNLGLDSNNTSTNLQMEEFYASVLDTDVLIYNGTIEGELETMDDFLALSPLFSDLKAVKNGEVYCSRSNLYQSSMELGEITQEIQSILNGKADNLNYFYKLS